jgi:hypothetical protein
MSSRSPSFKSAMRKLYRTSGSIALLTILPAKNIVRTIVIEQGTEHVQVLLVALRCVKVLQSIFARPNSLIVLINIFEKWNIASSF